MKLTTIQLTAILTTVFLVCAIPLLLMRFTKRRGGRWSTFFVGAGTFILFAMTLEQGLHALVLLGPWGSAIQSNIWLYGLYGGLAAGLFEETGRLVAFRFFLKKRTDPMTALSYGVGHGGVEAILIAGVNLVAGIVMVQAAASGAITDEATLAAAAQVAATPAGMFLWAAFERCSAIIFHIAASVLVFAAVRLRKPGLWVLAFALHAGMDFLAVVLNQYAPVAVTELAVLASALVMAYLARRTYRDLPDETTVE